MYEFLGSEHSPVTHQPGDIIEINGSMAEVTQVLPVGVIDGVPQYTVLTRPVRQDVDIPAPVQFGLNCLKFIGDMCS